MEERDYAVENLKEKRMEKAVAVSAGMFLKQGIDSVKMTDIAEATGVGVATLYRYFGTKTGIAIAAMTYLWNELNAMVSGVFESDSFRRKNGMQQLTELMRVFLVLYTSHGDFMKLLGEFDLFLLQEDIPKEDLADYEKSVINFYPVFETAYKKGVADGTVREVENFPLFYLTYAHAFMELNKKLLRGEVLASDDFSHGERELETMIETAVYFFEKR